MRQQKNTITSASTNGEARCVKCLDAVKAKQDSMACDSCERFTHLSCDDKIPKPLYDMLNQYPDNTLVYFCGKCKPLLLPSADKADILSKKIEDACKQKIRNIREEQNRPLDFLVKKNECNRTRTSITQVTC